MKTVKVYYEPIIMCQAPVITHLILTKILSIRKYYCPYFFTDKDIEDQDGSTANKWGAQTETEIA